MTTNDVSIGIRVTAEGLDSVRQVNDELKKLGQTTDDGVKKSGKKTEAEKAAVKVDKEWASTMRDTRAITGIIGADFLVAASAIGAVASVLGASVVSANSLWLGLGGLAEALNRYTGAQATQNDALALGMELADKYGLSIADVTSNLAPLLKVTHDENAALGLFNLAVEAHKASGKDLSEIIKEMAGAIDGSVKVFDANRQQMVNSTDAAKTLAAQIRDTGTAFTSTSTDINDRFIGMLKDMAGALGTAVKAAFTYLVEAPIVYGDKFLGNFADWLVTAGAWVYDHTKTAMESALRLAFHAVGDGIKGLIGAEWNIWDWIWEKGKEAALRIGTTLKDAFVDAFKVIANAIIWVINKIVDALDLIHVEIPSWVPGLGGKSFGISIPNVPTLAEGGITNGPTLAMVGDNPGGREAIIPLDRAGGLGSTINLYLSDGTPLAQWLWNEMDAKVRQRGGK